MPQLLPRRNIQRILEDLPIRQIQTIRDAEKLCDYTGRCTVPDVRMQVWDISVTSINPLSIRGFVSNPHSLNAIQKVAKEIGTDVDTTQVKTLPENNAYSFGFIRDKECPLYATEERKERVDTAIHNETLIVLQQKNNQALIQAPNGYLGWVNTTDYQSIAQDVWARIISPANIPDSIQSKQQILCDTAKRFLGTPYVWGGADENGIDCSGFIRYIYQRIGILLPRDADQQFTCGTICSFPGIREALRAGDLLFFSGDYGGISHIGMALDPDTFIHAKGGKVVMISNFEAEQNLKSRFLMGKRIIL